MGHSFPILIIVKHANKKHFNNYKTQNSRKWHYKFEFFGYPSFVQLYFEFILMLQDTRINLI